ncbi:hypothetical protein [Clostridium sp.]
MAEEISYLNNLDEVFELTTSFYNEINNITEPPNFEVIITKDIYTESLKLISESEREEELKYNNENDTSNGRMISKTKLMPFFILLNEKQFDNKFSFLGTYYHELTHVIDFDKYMGQVNAKDIKDLKNDSYFWVFYLWTEFHARYMGYSMFQEYINYINKYKENIEERINFIETSERLYHIYNLGNVINEFETNLSMPKNIAFQSLFYEISQFYGRFAKWQEYGIELEYDGNILLNKFVNIRNELIEYYNVLVKCKDYSGYEQHKNELQNLINEMYNKI